MEELLLETPEEPLRGRVVRGAALRAHGSGQLVFPADADPSGPPVMAAAVGVDDRTLPVAERGARVAEHPVGQLGVRARADRPGEYLTCWGPGLLRLGAIMSFGEYLTCWGPGLLRLGAIMSFGGYCVSRPGLLRLGAVVG